MINSLFQVGNNINYQLYKNFQDKRSFQPDLLIQDVFISQKKLSINKMQHKYMPAFSGEFGYDFELKKQTNLPCPCCGKIMLSEDESNQFIFDMQKASGKRLITGLNKYLDRLPETERNVSKMVIKLAKNDKDNRPLIAYLRSQYKGASIRLEHKQRQILKEISGLSKDLTGKTRIKVYNYIEVNTEKIDRRRKDNPIVVWAFQRDLEKLWRNESDPENKKILEKIIKTSKKMPTSKTDADAFIVKYSNKSTKTIAYRLIRPICASTEHIKPFGAEGTNSPENYLAECFKCNEERGQLLYSKWIKIHPEMIENSQKYINTIIDRIILGRIRNFDFYPQAVKKALEEESDYGIVLNIDRMNEYLERKNKQNLNSDSSGSELATVI